MYSIMLYNGSIKLIFEYCVSAWASCNEGLLDDSFKFKNNVGKSSIFLLRLEPYLYAIILDGYLLITLALKDV